MIGPRDGELDLMAVARDDELLDLLGARADLAAGAQGEPDDAVRLLQALARDVDEGLDELLATPLPGQRPRRRTLARGTALALVVGATLSVGGVSAAVTGDPLAGYRAVATALGLHSELPPSAAEIAKWNHTLAQARAVARAGDTAAATAMLDRLEQRLGELPANQRAAMTRKIAALRARLADAAGAGRSDGVPGQGRGPAKAPGEQRRADDHADQGGAAGQPAKPDKAVKPVKPAKPATGEAPRQGTDGGSDGPAGQGNGRAGRTSDAPSAGDQPAPTATTDPVAPTPEPTATTDPTDTATKPGKSRGNASGRATRAAESAVTAEVTAPATDAAAPGGAANGRGGNPRR